MGPTWVCSISPIPAKGTRGYCLWKGTNQSNFRSKAIVSTFLVFICFPSKSSLWGEGKKENGKEGKKMEGRRKERRNVERRKGGREKETLLCVTQSRKGILLSEPPLKSYGHLCDSGWLGRATVLGPDQTWTQNSTELGADSGRTPAIPARGSKAIGGAAGSSQFGSFLHSCLPDFLMSHYVYLCAVLPHH